MRAASSSSSSTPSTDKLGDKPIFQQVLRLRLAQQLGVALSADGSDVGLERIAIGLEAEGFLTHTARNHLFEPDERAAADEQDIGGIDRGKFLVRMLAPALRWNRCDRAFEQLK